MVSAPSAANALPPSTTTTGATTTTGYQRNREAIVAPPDFSRDAPGVLELSPYVVAVPALHAQLSVESARILRVDPLHTRSVAFLDRLRCFDQLVYEPAGLGIPRWAMYDTAEIPGLVCGFAAAANAVPGELVDSLGGSDDDSAVIPLSMAIATPTLVAEHWIVYALGQAPTDDDRLPARTLDLAISLVGASRITTAVQWRSPMLQAYADYAPFRLRAAWLPAHTIPATAIVDLVPGERTMVAPTRHVDLTDDDQLLGLQRDIETGATVRVAGGLDSPRIAIEVTPR